MANQFSIGDEDGSRMAWDLGDDPAEGEGAAEGDAPEGAEGPALPDLDEETRTQVESYYAHQREQERQRLQESGLDLTPDGQPVIRDPARFAQWAGQAPGVSRQAPPPPPPPAPAAPPPEEEPVQLDPLSMTGPEMQAAIEKIVAKATAPLVQQNQELRGQIQRQGAARAYSGVRQALEQYAPGLAGIVDHPDFAELYQKEAASLRADMQEDPRWMASLAGSLLPWLMQSPNTPPGWSPVTGQAPPPPNAQLPTPSSAPARDAQGRFTEVARSMANRQNVGQVPPARGGMMPPAPRDETTRQTERFVDAFRGYATGKVAGREVRPGDGEAAELEDYQEFLQATRGNGRGRR